MAPAGTDEHRGGHPRVSFLGRDVPPGFRMRVVAIQPGASVQYVSAEWDGSLVVVERGAIHVECDRGGIRVFRSGAVMWLVDLPLRAIHNRCPEPAVLVAVSRRAMSFDSACGYSRDGSENGSPRSNHRD